MFYEDQHKLAAYLERTGAAFEYQTLDMQKRWFLGGGVWSASEYVKAGHPIRPVLRYGLPSHLQSEIHNPDNLTDEQICEGGKYRAVVKLDSCTQPHDLFTCNGWVTADVGDCTFESFPSTYRLPATVPWPDWKREEAAQPDPKDARIAELETALAEAQKRDAQWVTKYEQTQELWNADNCRNNDAIEKLEAQLATSPWRRMSEVPTEEDRDKHGYVFGLHARHGVCVLLATGLGLSNWPGQDKDVLAWMPVPKFPGWPDPLADLLKAHGAAVTPELTAALNAWKGVEK